MVKKSFVLIFVLAFAVCFSMGVYAANCGDVITESVTLTDNISCSVYGDGLTIGADNVVLDCKGYSLIGLDNNNGIFVDDQKNITILNCNIKNFSYGIYLQYVDGANITNNSVSLVYGGFYLDSSLFIQATGNVLNGRSGWLGVRFDNSSNNTFTNNSMMYYSGYGVYSSDLEGRNSQNNNLSGNTICFNSEDKGDIYFSDASSNFFGSNVFDILSDGYALNTGLTKSSSCVPPEFVQGECGQFLGQSIVLTEDILNCPETALSTRLDNITIDCDGHSITGAGANYGVFSRQNSGFSIKNCVMSGFSYSDIYLKDTTGGRIENNTLNESVSESVGVYLETSSNASIIENNFSADDSSAYGIYFAGCSDTSVIENNFFGNDYGGEGIYLGYSDDNSVNSTGNNISYNKLVGNYNGLYLDQNSDNNHISYNNFSENSYGVYLNYADNNFILDNNFTGNDYGFYLVYADNNQIGRNYVDSVMYNFGESSSCPFLYTWNGTGYTFVSDMSTEGKLSLSKLYPDDYLKIDGNQLQPVDNKYNLQVTEEYDEISFIDQLKLMTIDHSPDVDVFNGLARNDSHSIYSVSKTPSPVVSCQDSLNNDCLSAISAKDGVFTMSPLVNITNMVTLNLGNLSNASEIKLIISYSWVNGYLVPNYKKSVQLKDGSGNWVSILSDSDLTTRAALQKTYVLNLTGKFLTDDYSVRLVLPIQAIDYVAVDTTPQQEVTIKEYNPLTADLHYRGYSRFITNITRMFYYDDLINQSFSTPSGNFTKYGDVSSLVNSTDDKYAIIGHGDEISASFAYEPVPDGMQRDFLMFEYAYYKPASLNIGKQVEPLPFGAMSKYPYNETESYPSSLEYQTYLSEYNTRQMSSVRYGGSLPYSENNSVFENNFIANGEESFGLYLYSETDTKILNNNFSGTGTGIMLDYSTGTNVSGNNISTGWTALDVTDYSASNTIQNNNLSSSDYYAIYVHQTSSSNDFFSNNLNSSRDYADVSVAEGCSGNNFLHNSFYGKSWVTDADGGNYYNDTYSGNIYYLEDGTPAWESYDLVDSNSDGWADSGNVPFDYLNTAVNNSCRIDALSSYPNASCSIAYIGSSVSGWDNNDLIYDGDWSTGSFPLNGEAYLYLPLQFSKNISNAVLNLGSNISNTSIEIPAQCLTLSDSTYALTLLINATTTLSELNVFCNDGVGDILLDQVTDTNQMNEFEISYTTAYSTLWSEEGADYHPAINENPIVRKVNVNLVSPANAFTSSSGNIAFSFNPSTNFGSIEYCNLTARSATQRTSEVSSDANGLVGLWHFNSDLIDSSGNSNNGEPIESVEINSSSKFGDGALYLDGSNYVSVPDSDSLDSTETTVSFWIKYTGEAENIVWNRIVSKKNAWFDNDGFEITMVSSSDSQIYAAGSGDSPYVQVDCVDSWSAHEWHHVAISFGGSTATVYCDGLRKGSGTINPIVANDKNLFFGGDQGQKFNGYLDEVSIFNYKMSESDIKDLYSLSYKNYSNSISNDSVNRLSLNLSNGSYNWYVSCTDDAGLVGTSPTRTLTINATSTTEEENVTSEETSTYSYSPHTYYSDVNLPTSGNNFNLRHNDKIKFIVHSNNHTLTMQNFNSTTARVLIQSNPITADLQKGILYEFDLNNDSVKDVRVRYDGMNKSSAMIFIQEIVLSENNNLGFENEEDFPLLDEKTKFSFILGILLLIVLIVLSVILYFYFRSVRKHGKHYTNASIKYSHVNKKTLFY